jgi:transposase
VRVNSFSRIACLHQHIVAKSIPDPAYLRNPAKGHFNFRAVYHFLSMLDTLCALLLPDPAAVALETVTFDVDRVTATLRTTIATAACPRCGQQSTTIHARYQRTLADLPWAGRVVALRLQVRRFRCPNRECAAHTFTERLPTIAPPYAHRTPRLAMAQRDLALAHGGEAGAHTAQRQGMAVSPDTLLRLSRQARPAPVPQPTAVGIDEWALHKGRRYAAIVVDLETHQVLDLLPDDQPRRWLPGWRRIPPSEW